MRRVLSFTMDSTLFDSQDEVQEIDKRINELNYLIQMLRRERNTKSGANTLPMELLARVFSFVLDDSHWAYHSLNEESSVSCAIRQRVAFTHVCSHWRGVALSSPFLWSNFTFAHTYWTPEMLSRAKEAPLSVVVSSLTRDAPIIAILSNLHRIKRLDISIKDMEPTSWLPYLSQPAPLLDTLTIDAFWCSTAPIHLPQPLFAGFARSLKNVTLRGCRLTWGLAASIFSEVRLLSVSWREERNVSPEEFGEMMLALPSMPHLRELTLEQVFPSTVDPASFRGPIVFPSLCDLSFRGRIQTLSLLTQRLDAPQLRTIALDCTPASTVTQQDITSCFELVSFAIDFCCKEGADGPRLLMLARTEYPNQGLTIGLSKNEALAMTPYLMEYPSLYDIFIVLPAIREPIIRKIVALIRKRIPLCRLQSLVIGDVYSRSQALSVRAFKEACNLQTIIVLGSDAFEVVKLLESHGGDGRHTHRDNSELEGCTINEISCSNLPGADVFCILNRFIHCTMAHP
jgi:hypothetical protein